MKKTIDDLKAIREGTRLCPGKDGDTRIVVGMATCGIAAGASPVLEACKDEMAKLGISNASVEQTGCIGACWLEPIMEVYSPGGERTTYVEMTADKARRVMQEHIAGGKVVTELTIGAEG